MLPSFPVDGSVPPIATLLLLLLIAFAAGTVGSLLGLGGGLFLVPGLVILFGVNIHLAIAASLVSVIATSCGSASTGLEAGLTDLRVGMFLETATAVGGLVGALVAVTLLATQDNILIFAFIPAVLFAAVLMFFSRHTDVRAAVPPDAIADRLKLHGAYFDETENREIQYRVTGTRQGLLFAGLSGGGSGLLGIGGGLFNVPAMHSFMNVPFRVAGATSTFMIGVTASAGAIVYLVAGDVSLVLAAPVALGMLGGSQVGTRLQTGTSPTGLKALFVVVLLVAAGLMALRGVGVLQ